jgi:outer membrane protein assembly factor BamB
MFSVKRLAGMIHRAWKCRSRLPQRPKRFASTRRLYLEALEDRLCPSGGYLVVGSYDNNMVLRYNESTGAFVDQFDPHNLANLKNPTAGVFGSDGNLYVSSGIFQNNNQKVVQYNGTTGAFQSVFASQNITSPRSELFGPDGNLYVADGNSAASGDPASVERFDGKTGAFLNYFVAPSNNGGLEHPTNMVFGPDGTNDGKLDLYVAAAHQGAIYRYDGTTGAFKGVFVSATSGGLDAPLGMVFGPDGNLYVASGNWFTSSNGPF